MRNFIVLGTAVLLTACGSNEKPEPVKQVDNRSCSQKMYDLGETIRSLHRLGYSRANATRELKNMYGPAVNQLADFTSVVWSQPAGFWSKGEIGGQLRDAAIAQGCR